MKQVIFAISLLALVNCKDTKQQEAKIETVEQPVELINEGHNEYTSNVYANVWIKDIELDNSRKWPANTETKEGVQNMQNIIKTQTAKTLDDYYKLAERLNNDKNYVIKNCTMKGASHDNLHIWLLPLMDKIEALSQAKTLKEALKLKYSIEGNLNAYNDYFE
ncbi:hypothetical protein ES692_00490 [Psychroserpens burtonensis]|uniref:Uncharacterized protein n=1 Tax=Psychroserpens burtonensis TaxID=49278 RepID=A0A5C7BCY4_9FLAO|nr:hypothetical protein [Psychroserpens burtonensis]TXE20304.1 hypothetical protein ES692_00490 [Psychroserpens burtonensis]